MALLWTIVSCVLAVEIVVLLVLCAPLPWGVRKNISRWIYKLKAHDLLDSALKYVAFALFLSLAEAINGYRQIKFAKKEHGTNDDQETYHMNVSHEYRWKQARAERNMYLATFSITAVIAIARLIRLAAIEVQLRNKIKEYNGNKPLNEVGETIDDNTTKSQFVKAGKIAKETFVGKEE